MFGSGVAALKGCRSSKVPRYRLPRVMLPNSRELPQLPWHLTPHRACYLTAMPAIFAGTSQGQKWSSTRLDYLWVLGAGAAARCRVSGKRFQDVYMTGRKLGEGSFGAVYEVAHRSNESTIRVCKVIQKSSADKAKTSHQRVREEFAVLKRLDHPHVVRIFEDFEDERSEEQGVFTW
ncbi:Calcium-dependent protein kinase 1 [Symbiodinium microadriaticum]|uniref:Calcium-dependent protein kinase 1 n=1 Tax=Symbiodinium microadriaticum TaxID=2951 RepID=A0A1Q9CKK2_SYMMI|nr:Calcium-dependent protein kinase 1 [Symbiodinium microadriaticum]